MCNDETVRSEFSISGKISVVTGGASGIGQAIAQKFAQHGSEVAVLDLVVPDGNGSAGDVFAQACNVSDPASVKEAVSAVMARYGRIDVLVNCAGVARLAPAEDLALVDWQQTIDVNLTGTFLMCQEVGRHMLAAGKGRIVNIASQAGTVAIPEHAAYCASKFAVLGLTRVLAQEWGGRGINANSLSPTVVLTELGKKVWAGPKGDAHKAQIPKGRFALPEEVAAAALFLACDAADMINGADLLVDGGFTIG